MRIPRHNGAYWYCGAPIREPRKVVKTIATNTKGRRVYVKVLKENK